MKIDAVLMIGLCAEYAEINAHFEIYLCVMFFYVIHVQHVFTYIKAS